MSGGAVAVYDLSRSCGWAVYAPGRGRPRHGVMVLPPTRSDGSNGPAFKLLFEHIAWIDRKFGGLAHIGYEAFIAPPTSDANKEKSKFRTTPTTLKRLAGLIGVLEMCAEMLEAQSHSIHNMSWRSYWLGSQKRGTTRDRWKELAVARAKLLGWEPHGDDDADAIGQLHWLLDRLSIEPVWLTQPSLQLETVPL